MHCPECQKELIPLKTKDKKNQDRIVFGCSFCNGFWLDYFQANDISLTYAQNLITQLPKAEKSIHASNSLLCPTCQVNLETQRAESIPLNCTVYRCPKCSGNWFPQNQLLNFKKAQRAKLNYFKTWQIPLGSPFTILLPILIITIIGLSIPVTVYLVQKNQEQRTQALELIKNVNVYQIDSLSVLITWETNIPVISELEFGQTWLLGEKIPVSLIKTTLHQVTIRNLKSGIKYYYRIIILKDKKETTLPFSSFIKE